MGGERLTGSHVKVWPIKTYRPEDGSTNPSLLESNAEEGKRQTETHVKVRAIKNHMPEDGSTNPSLLESNAEDTQRIGILLEEAQKNRQIIQKNQNVISI